MCWQTIVDNINGRSEEEEKMGGGANLLACLMQVVSEDPLGVHDSDSLVD